MSTASPSTASPVPHHRWSAVFAMSLGAFALVSSEFMPVSLLTPIAADLHVSEGMAGQGIAVSGIFALLTSLFITTLAGRLDRKLLLLLLTMLMVVSGTVVALSPEYVTFIIGRALIGIAIGGFWSMTAATVMRLVPLHQLPRALAIVNGGNALATVLAAPLGSFLGAIIGWRGAFFFTVPVAVLTVCWLWRSLPSMKVEPQSGSANVFALLKRRAVAAGMAAVSLFFMGQFTLFTYLRPFLETVTRVNSGALSLLLLVLGVSGFIGTVLIGRLLKNRLYATLFAIPLMMALIACGLIALGHSPIATAILLGLWGLLATSAPVGWWTWLAATLPDDAEAGGGLMVAIVQLAITLGATLGGVMFDVSGYRATFTLSAVMLLLAALLAVVAARAAKQ